MNEFENLLDEFLSGLLSDSRHFNESAVTDYYYLVNYPYTQGSEETRALGEKARQLLLNLVKKRMHEVSPPGWSGSVKALKRAQSRGDAPKRLNPWAITWAARNKGYRPHYKPTDDPKRLVKYKKYRGE